jgi:hypothetical protein
MLYKITMSFFLYYVASEIDRAVQHLLEQNNLLLNQIETNIRTFQVCAFHLCHITLFNLFIHH